MTKRLNLQLIREFDFASDWIRFTPDHQSVAMKPSNGYLSEWVQFPSVYHPLFTRPLNVSQWQLFDLTSGEQIVTLGDHLYYEFSPDGQTYLTKHADKIVVSGLDGSMIEKVIPKQSAEYDVCYSSDNQYLWCVYDDEYSKGVVSLLDPKTLKTVDRIHASSDYYPHRSYWDQVFFVRDLSSNRVAIEHTDSSTFFGIFFFGENNGNIETIYRPITTWDDGKTIYPMTNWGFSNDGHYFVGMAGRDFNIWSLPDLDLKWQPPRDYFVANELPHKFTFIDGDIVVAAGQEMQSRTLVTSLHLFNLETGHYECELTFPEYLLESKTYAFKPKITLHHDMLVFHAEEKVFIYQIKVVSE